MKIKVGGIGVNWEDTFTCEVNLSWCLGEREATKENGESGDKSPWRISYRLRDNGPKYRTTVTKYVQHRFQGEKELLKEGDEKRWFGSKISRERQVFCTSWSTLDLKEWKST